MKGWVGVGRRLLKSMYMYVHPCTHIHTYDAYNHERALVHTHTEIDIHMHARTDAHTHITCTQEIEQRRSCMTLNKNEFIMVPFSFIGCIEIRKNRPANVMEPMHACMHVSMHACMHACICVYIHTQIHTFVCV